MQTSCLLFQIADVVFRYNYNKEITISNNMTIHHFLLDPDSQHDIINNIIIGSKIDFSSYKLKKPIFETPAWSHYGDTIIFHPNGKYIAKMESKDDYKCVNTYLEELDTSVHPLPICITGFLLQQYLVSNNSGFIMHGATLAIDNDGCIFTGNSGVGKSTISKLIRQYLNSEQISDDRFILKLNHGDLYSYGNPFDSKIERNINKGIKITKLFFLYHGDKNLIEKIDKTKLVQKLMTVSLLPYGDKENMLWAIQYLIDFANKVECYDFYFLPDASSIKELYQFLSGDYCD